MYASPITILAPATPAYRELDSKIIDRLQPVNIIDKPPLSSDLERLLLQSINSDPQSSGQLSAHLQARVLIVEDYEFTRILLSTFFEGSQCEVLMATNGLKAIELCGLQHVDLVLMDVHMPEVNGINALKTIREGDGPNKHTPVIMLTADILQQEETIVRSTLNCGVGLLNMS